MVTGFSFIPDKRLRKQEGEREGWKEIKKRRAHRKSTNSKQQNHSLQIALTEYLIQIIIFADFVA